jgi:hypothetical protein
MFDRKDLASLENAFAREPENFWRADVLVRRGALKAAVGDDRPPEKF